MAVRADDYTLYVAQRLGRLLSSPVNREILRLWALEDLSPTEIARALNLDPDEVRRVLKAARRYSPIDARRAILLFFSGEEL